MRITLSRQFHTSWAKYDNKIRVLGGITIYILPMVKFYKINNTVSFHFSWLCWGLILEFNAYYDKGTTTFKVQ